MCTPWIITESEGRKGGKQEGKPIRLVHLGLWDFPWFMVCMWMERNDQDACVESLVWLLKTKQVIVVHDGFKFARNNSCLK